MLPMPRFMPSMPGRMPSILPAMGPAGGICIVLAVAVFGAQAAPGWQGTVDAPGVVCAMARPDADTRKKVEVISPIPRLCPFSPV